MDLFNSGEQYEIVAIGTIDNRPAPLRLSNLIPSILGVVVENPSQIHNNQSLGSANASIPWLSRLEGQKNINNYCTALVEQYFEKSMDAEFYAESTL